MNTLIENDKQKMIYSKDENNEHNDNTECLTTNEAHIINRAGFNIILLVLRLMLYYIEEEFMSLSYSNMYIE